jgi:hypothetical protein
MKVQDTLSVSPKPCIYTLLKQKPLQFSFTTIFFFDENNSYYEKWKFYQGESANHDAARFGDTSQLVWIDEGLYNVTRTVST